ncbi:hypothetical protein MKW92_029494 [Papaver armeniacum]|nr:hypothetical protein MKW92_029494 [Papaver armeniacum]
MEESSYNNSSSSSSTIRFLGILKQPATTNNNNNHTSDSSDLPFELDESDVIWSSSAPSASSSPDLPNQSITATANDFIITESNSSPTLSSPSTLSNSSPRNSFRSDKFGLSAALSDDNYHHNNHLQRKRSLNSPLSAASTAVRMIPPIPIQRSNGGVGSGGGGGGSGSGGGGSFLGSSSLGKYPYNQSAPVNVPVWPNRNHRSGSGGKKVFYEDDDDDVDDGSYAEMLPPHEIVARSHLTTFSVFEGVGRTLKGRDLRRVRNAVMQKTGFLD